MSVKKIPARGEQVEVTLTFTADEWKKIETAAAWDYSGGAEAYIKWRALGGQKRGC
jgi:hypothetical protein